MNSFSLENVDKKNLESVISFVQEREANSVALMSRLIDGSWQNSIYEYFVLYENVSLLKKEIVAVLCKSHGGLVQHCVKNALGLMDNADFQKALKPFFTDIDLYCIMGERNANLLLQKVAEKYCTQKKILQQNEYLMLLYNPENLPDELINPTFDFEIEECNPSDTENLFELQKEYDIVEVLPHGCQFLAENCRRSLCAMLKKQTVYAIKKDGMYVAKAGTNAIGKNYVQFGGVFTKTEYRGHGMAQCLVSALAKHFTSLGKECALFVRSENTCAKAAYRKAGFFYQNDYLITYYESN